MAAPMTRIVNTVNSCLHLFSHLLPRSFPSPLPRSFPSPLPRSFPFPLCHRVIPVACYAKKPAIAGALKPGKGSAAIPQKKRLDPEQDAGKLVRFLCGGNILKEGTDPELRPHSEYPEWLWSLRTERGSPPLEELEVDTWAYWRRIHKINRKTVNMIMKNKYRYHKF